MRLHSFRFSLSAGFRFVGVLAAAALLSHCSSPVSREAAPAPASDYMPSPVVPDSSAGRASIAKSRPGLGTQLGHEIHDHTSSEAFYRKSSGVPDAVATFHYNDKEGAELMAKLEGGSARRSGGSFELIADKLRVTVKNSSWGGGNALDYYRTGQGIYVIGEPGGNYSLNLENRTSHRMEVVVSVDGLSLHDGQPASVKKRGYVIPAKSSISVRGMRVNGKMFSLKFGAVGQSRASTAFGEKGARNVGVVGIACYEEDEQARRRVQVQENYVRQGASAFGN